MNKDENLKALNIMIKAAKEAGKLSKNLQKNRNKMEVKFKGPADLLCYADEQTEDCIKEFLFNAYPNFSYCGEEKGEIIGSNKNYLWLVDPIDGTTNFLSGLEYTITIALRYNNNTISGVVYNPIADEMFTVTKGGGSFLNNKRIKVSKTNDHRRYLIGTGIPTKNIKYSEKAYIRLENIRENIAGIRITGSAAYSLALVACGKLDGYFEGTVGLLDTAAGVLLVQEAGGIVSDFWGQGKEYFEKNVTYVSGNKSAHLYIVEKINNT